MIRVKESFIIVFLMLFLFVNAGRQSDEIETEILGMDEPETRTEIVVLETEVKEGEQSEGNYIWYEDEWLLKNGPVQDEAWRLAVAGVYQYAEQEKGEFEPNLDYEGTYPEELVIRLEEEVFGSLDYDLNIKTWEEALQSSYFEMLSEFGAEKYEVELDEIYVLFPELEGMAFESKYEAYDHVYDGRANCTDMFHFQLAPGEDNYLFVLDYEGTSGIAEIELTRREKDEFIIISQFQTPNFGYGKVIEFAGEFYYLFAQRNYNLKNYDGIRIYKLGANAETENLLISYLPQDYIWETSYWGDWGAGNFNTMLDEYLESIKMQLTSNRYIENGQVEDGGRLIFFGDEVREDGMHDGIDFTNTGIPVYMERTSFTPSNGLKSHLQVQFFTSSSQTVRTEALEKLDIADGVGEFNLVQLWFKEFGEKVVTFRLYHVSDYNYLLNVILQEGSKVTTLRDCILIPQRELILIEGNVYRY